MRIEREDDRGAADFACVDKQPLDETSMPAMDAVEVADGDGAGTKIGGQVVEGAEETQGRIQGSGVRLGEAPAEPLGSSVRAAAMRVKRFFQSRTFDWRKSRMVGYQGVSSRSRCQRQSGACIS